LNQTARARDVGLSRGGDGSTSIGVHDLTIGTKSALTDRQERALKQMRTISESNISHIPLTFVGGVDWVGRVGTNVSSRGTMELGGDLGPSRHVDYSLRDGLNKVCVADQIGGAEVRDSLTSEESLDSEWNGSRRCLTAFEVGTRTPTACPWSTPFTDSACPIDLVAGKQINKADPQKKLCRPRSTPRGGAE
jgi:hypothetical protein